MDDWSYLLGIIGVLDLKNKQLYEGRIFRISGYLLDSTNRYPQNVQAWKITRER